MKLSKKFLPLDLPLDSRSNWVRSLFLSLSSAIRSKKLIKPATIGGVDCEDHRNQSVPLEASTAKIIGGVDHCTWEASSIDCRCQKSIILSHTTLESSISRYDRDVGNKDRHEVDARGRHDSKAISGSGARSRCYSRSISPRAEARGCQVSKTISRGSARSRSNSCSLSPRAEARGYQVSKTIPRGSARSRSNSRSSSPRIEARGRQDAKAISRGRVRSRGKSCSSSPSPKRARVGRGHSQSRSRSNSRGVDRGAERYGKSTAAHRQSPVPKIREPFSDNRSRDRPGHSPVTYSPQQRKSTAAHRQSPVPKIREPFSDNRSRDRPGCSPVTCSPQQRKSSSYDDGEIRDDRHDLSPRARPERSRSPVQSRDDRLVCSPSPRMVRSRSPYIDNGRREGSCSPGQGHQRSPNYPNGVEGPLNKNQPAQLYYDGDEEEEGMILPDEEEGIIHPDTISGK